MKLSDQIEAATGAERELFEAAFAACFPKPTPDCEPTWRPENPKQSIFHAWKVRQIAFDHFVRAEAWTDAALTLVPDGRSWGLDCNIERLDEHQMVTSDTACSANIYHEGSKRWQGDECWGTTPALALCAAALRARGL